MAIVPHDTITQKWWLSCNKFTVQVNTQYDIIVEAAPIVARFKYQPLENLKQWMRKFGGCKMARLDTTS